MTRKTEAKGSHAKKSRIPEFKSRVAEAKFWDTHDVTDYLDELKPVRLRVGKNLNQGITIRFDAETLEKLRARAQKKGLGPTTLARMWILERLSNTRD
jgi:hypothetical protein